MQAMSFLKGILIFVLLGFTPLTQGQLECKVTVHGINYLGLKNVTISGRTCQDWNSQYPHKHEQTDKIMLRNSRNYCRNPDGEPGGPWCYTNDRNKRWEYCNIPSCPISDEQCYEEGKGTAYLGKINVTETGYACRRWDSEAVFVYQVFEHLENYCRSPDGAPFPWCLSTAPGKRWEKCQIPICGRHGTTKTQTATTSATMSATNTAATTTFQQSTALKSENNSKNKERIIAANDGSCEQNSVKVEVVTVVTLVCVLLTTVGSIYIIVLLRHNRLQCFPGQNTPYALNNVYDSGVSDIQPIVYSSR